jgi:hypothetical protein
MREEDHEFVEDITKREIESAHVKEWNDEAVDHDIDLCGQ